MSADLYPAATPHPDDAIDTCGHCRRPVRGHASLNDTPLCHPDDGLDCYRLVTVYKHPTPCFECTSTVHDGAGPGSRPNRAQDDEQDSSARRLLDQAIAAALPLAGGRVLELVEALRDELVRVDAKRAERAED